MLLLALTTIALVIPWGFAVADDAARAPAAAAGGDAWAWEWTAPDRVADVRAWAVVQPGVGVRRVVAALLDDGALFLLDGEDGRPLSDGYVRLPPGSRLAGEGRIQIGRHVSPAALVVHHPARAMVVGPLLPLRADTLFERDLTPRLDADADPEFQTRLLQVAVRSPYLLGLWSDGVLQTFAFGAGEDRCAFTALPSVLPAPATGELFLTPNGVFYAYLEDGALRVLASTWRQRGERAGSAASVIFTAARPVVLTTAGDSLLGVDPGGLSLLAMAPSEIGQTSVEQYASPIDVVGAVARRYAVAVDGTTLAIVEKDCLSGFSALDASRRWTARPAGIGDCTVTADGDTFVVCGLDVCVKVAVRDGAEVQRMTVADYQLEAAKWRTFEIAGRIIRGYPPR